MSDLCPQRGEGETIFLLQEEGEEGGGEEEGEGREADKDWEEYTKEREKRLKLLEDLWEDEDTRKRKRKSALVSVLSVCLSV